MGVTGLWQLLEPTCTPVTLESLEGKRLAVDVSIWIYQAQLGYSSEAKNPHLALLMNRISKLLFYKIRPVFVFDGPDVPDLKRRVLNARRMQRYTQDMLLTKNKKRHLEEVAKGHVAGENVDKAVKKLSSPSKKFKADIELFNIPTTSTAPVIEVSDDDCEIVVEKEVRFKRKNTVLDRLIDVREKMRVSRLHPEMIPTDTDDFCKFQLQRVLQRNKIDRTIKELAKKDVDIREGSNVKMAVNDRLGNAHVISYDSDVQVVDSPQRGMGVEESSSDRNCLSNILDVTPSCSYLQPVEQDECFPDYFLSKSSMIEKLMKQRIGQQTTEAARADTWSSDSSSDDDQFIDVPDVPFPITGSPSEQKRESGDDDDDSVKEWNPALKSDENIVRELPVTDVQRRERDTGAYADIQEFLTACGFPWVESPGEAEAQCVELERLGLVQGVVSDDSDVWAFGVQNVYRYLFTSGKNVQHYSANKVKSQTGLTQLQFILIAIISGGDYSVGFHGVGVVSAVELLAELTPKSALGQEKEEEVLEVLSNVDSWLKRSQEEKLKDGPILRKIRKIIEDNNSLDMLEMADRTIVKAYLQPNVDSSTETFRWKAVDIEKVRQLILDRLGWDDDKFSKNVLQPLEKWNSFILGQTSYQRHITSYATQLTQSADEQRISLSKRAVTALNKLQKKLDSVELPELVLHGEVLSNTVPGTSVKKTKQKNTTRGRSVSNLKATASKAKKVVVESKKDDLCLSESSDSD